MDLPIAIEEPKHTGFALNTMVLMFNGEVKPIHSLVKGDQLMGDDNTPRSVISTEKVPCSNQKSIDTYYNLRKKIYEE
ncbi:hypothetical protein EBU71_13575 [bacterium]|nr:hypothetical protein [Candidatus Elulimicrobium humile]